MILAENEELLTCKDKELEIEIVEKTDSQLTRKPWRKFLSFFNSKTLYKARTIGWWEDLNELSDHIDNSEDETHEDIDDNVKNTFSYWKKSQTTPLKVPLFGYDRVTGKPMREVTIICLKYVFIFCSMILFIVLFNFSLKKIIHG